MPNDSNQQEGQDSQPQFTHHHCGNLFGCAEEKGTGVLREDIKDAAFTPRVADRLLHMDEMNQERLDGYLTARGQSRRSMLRASSFLATLAAVGPWFSRLAHAGMLDPNTASDKGRAKGKKDDEGKVHVVECNEKTVKLGVFDTTAEPVAKVEKPRTIHDLPSLDEMPEITYQQFVSECRGRKMKIADVAALWAEHKRNLLANEQAGGR
jgi:hypothetical protein